MTDLARAKEIEKQVRTESLLKTGAWGLFAAAVLLSLLLLYAFSVADREGLVLWKVIVPLLLLIVLAFLGGQGLMRATRSGEAPEQKWSRLGCYLGIAYFILCALPGFAISAAESGGDRTVALAVFMPSVALYLTATVCFAAKRFLPGSLLFVAAGALNLPAEFAVVYYEGTTAHHFIGILHFLAGITAMVVGGTILNIYHRTRS
jgi:hypothetical protein